MSNTEASYGFRPKVGRPPAMVVRLPEAEAAAPRRNLPLLGISFLIAIVCALILGKVIGGFSETGNAVASALPPAREVAPPAFADIAPAAGTPETLRAENAHASLVGSMALIDRPETPVSVYSANAAPAIDNEDRKRLLSILSKD